MIDRIETALGAQAAKRLLAAFGGTRITIPKTPDGSRLAQDAGADVAAWLCEQYPAQSIDIPQGGRRARAALRRETVAANPALSANELARRLGVSARYVRMLRKELSAQSPEKRTQ